jgi:beta-glucosidase
MRTLNGAWTYSWQGDKVEEFAGEYNTILEAVENEIGAEKVTHVPGVQYNMDGQYFEQDFAQLDKAVAEAKKADVVILAVGENSVTEKPGDLNDLYLADEQTELAQQIAATGTPVVLVLNENRPRIISKFEQDMDGIVQIYQPGNFGGDALADVLFGDVNPSGKLPYNYPRYSNSLVGHIHKPSEEQDESEGMYNYEADYNPQYEFGHGLSYTTFSYSNFSVSDDTLRDGEQMTVSVEVTNTGDRAGKETVELNTADLYASSVTPDTERLRRFQKFALEAGQSRTVSFTILPQDLAFANRDGEMVTESGTFEISIEDKVIKFEYVK